MARKTPPALPGAPKFKRQAKVTQTEVGGTRTEIDVVPDDPTQPTREGNVDLFIAQALERFNMALQAEAYNRLEGLQDTLMVDGEGQWDPSIRRRREKKHRPCLTINRFKPMVAHVANEHRLARTEIQIDPVGGGADKDSASIRQGLIRHIHVDSHAQTVFDTAFERMIEKGWSWFRIVTDWESPVSHRQVIKIEGFTNDFAVYGDPNAEDPTRRDMKWGFVVYDMPRGQYMTQHPGSQAAGLTNFSSVGDVAPGWLTAESVRVCEYYYLDETPVDSARLIGGDGIFVDEIEERDGLWYLKAQLAAMDAGEIQPEQVQPVPVELDGENLITRKSCRLTPMWCKINAVEILDGDMGDDFKKNTKGRPIAGKYIPLIMMSGRERMVNGQRRLEGMVRANRDVQRMYNYLASGFIEMVALAPKSPYIAAIGQIEEFKQLWDKLNEENYAYLPYKEKSVGNNVLPPPQRQDNRIAESASGYLQGLAQFDNMLKQGFNIFDPSLGTARSDQSGRAIAGLQARSDSANMNWTDNASRAKVFAGEVILEMLPIIYDSKRMITIIHPDNKREEVQINAEFGEPDPVTGKRQNYDMSVGKYSCTVSVGQYASKRQEAVQTLSDIAKNVPQTALALLPLILGQMDTPMAEEAAAIVKRMQPPEWQDPGSPEQMAANFQALLQQHQLLVQSLDRANDLIKTKQLDLASKEYIAGLQQQAQIVGFTVKAGSAKGLQMATQEFQRIQKLLDQNHERLMAERQAAHDVGLEAMRAANQPVEGASAAQ